MADQKTIVFFPEAAFGPSLNSVGIAQACRELGHRCVFITDPGFKDVFAGYGFEEHHVNMQEPMPPEQMAKYWNDFINSHIPNFNLTPYEQVDNYVKECWEAIIATSKWAEKELPDVLKRVKPDVICIDNVVLYPATKRYGVPWVRIISCSENEIPDPDIPPHLSGCRESDKECHRRFEKRLNEVIKPIQDEFNEFLKSCGEEPYPLGQFFEESPYLNLLLYPEPVKFNRRNSLDPERFKYLEGCVRKEEPYQVPDFGAYNDKPLLYVSFGSLGAGDVDQVKKVIAFMGKQPYRALVNVGEYESEYNRETLPENVHIASWFPQPSVIPQADMVIHHGGNNTFTECLYFGVPAIIMPFVWDGHDNATRVEETGHGFKMHRMNWTDDELAQKIERCLGDETIRSRCRATAQHMQTHGGPKRAAEHLDALIRRHYG